MDEPTFSDDIAELERRLSIGAENKTKLISQLQTLEAEIRFLQRNLGYASAAKNLGNDNAGMDNEKSKKGTAA